MSYRTDSHNNPAAFTTAVADLGGLVEGIDFTQGDPFIAGTLTLHTARLIGDPIEQTIRVIDRVGYETHLGAPRWTYIKLPRFVWDGFTHDEKRDVIGYHYQREGGIAMRSLFPNYGKS